MNSLEKPEDYDLIVAIQSGEAAAFQKLYRNYWRPLFSFAYQATRDTDEAKDLLQDLFADLWQNRAAVQAKSFSLAYLYAMLRHKLLDRIRKQSVRQDYARLVSRIVTDVDNTTEVSVLANDFSEHLQGELDRLPERCRLIFQLSRFDGQPVDIIASQLNLSPQTVKNQLSKALQRLRHNLHEYATLAAMLIVSNLS